MAGPGGISDPMENVFKKLIPDQYSSLRLGIYARDENEYLAPFKARPDVWRICNYELFDNDDPLYIQYTQTKDIEKYAETVLGIVKAAFFPGLVFTGPQLDFDKLGAAFKAEVMANPALGKMPRTAFVFDVERL